MFIAIAAASYLIGSIPVGWLVGRVRGVDLFAAGSGNIGATNVGRVLGRKYGIIAVSYTHLTLPTNREV